jgi:hypothetical protein
MLAIPILKKWGIDMSNPETYWKECDKYGSGQVLLTEFCDWAISKNFSLEEDENVKVTNKPKFIKKQKLIPDKN